MTCPLQPAGYDGCKMGMNGTEIIPLVLSYNYRLLLDGWSEEKKDTTG